ncbi:hypothetical protein MTO96_026235 [Rhipicephalus appendiculatus]
MPHGHRSSQIKTTERRPKRTRRRLATVYEGQGRPIIGLTQKERRASRAPPRSTTTSHGEEKMAASASPCRWSSASSAAAGVAREGPTAGVGGIAMGWRYDLQQGRIAACGNYLPEPIERGVPCLLEPKHQRTSLTVNPLS